MWWLCGFNMGWFIGFELEDVNEVEIVVGIVVVVEMSGFVM